jgi:methionyl-tRNA synthetase
MTDAPNPTNAAPAPAPPAQPATIAIDDFAKVVLKTARVIEAKAHPKADKLLLLQVEIGDERRQIVAGIRASYAPEDLIDKRIVVITNLQPATIRGEQSNGMLLAVEEAGTISVLTPDRPVSSGLKVR